jgi:hypothetical protein
MIDAIARDVALHRYGLATCLHVPIAAVDEAAVTTYVGDVLQSVGSANGRRALLVRARPPDPPDPRFPVWAMAGSDILHQPLQLWVDVTYTRYRQAWRTAFPDPALGDQVLSHAMNRRVARLKGFRFVRLTPTSRSANSSAAFSERWAVALHGRPTQSAANLRRGAAIQYADVTDLMLMLNLRVGGGVMDRVNEGRALFRSPPD